MFKNIFNNSSINVTHNGGCINVNGQKYTGSTISIIGNKVFVDGKDQTPDAKDIRIEVVGDIQELEVDYANSILVEGNVGNIKSGSGDVSVDGNVTGNVTTGSGDVDCDNIIAGHVYTGSGDVTYKK